MCVGVCVCVYSDFISSRLILNSANLWLRGNQDIMLRTQNVAAKQIESNFYVYPYGMQQIRWNSDGCVRV